MRQSEVLQRGQPLSAEIRGQEVWIIDDKPRLQNDVTLTRRAGGFEQQIADFSTLADQDFSDACAASQDQLLELIARNNRLDVRLIARVIKRLHNPIGISNCGCSLKGLTLDTGIVIFVGINADDCRFDADAGNLDKMGRLLWSMGHDAIP